MVKNSTIYLAVRLSSDGYEWADVKTASGDPNACRDHARQTDVTIPQWAKENPVRRIARFTIAEAD